MPESVALELVVGDLGDEVGPHRAPGLFLLPAVRLPGHPAAAAAPGVLGAVGDPIRLEEAHQVGALRRREGRACADVLEDSLGIVESEQETAHDLGAIPSRLGVRTPTGHHDVGGALVLHLALKSLARRVGLGDVLDHQPIDAGGLEALEPGPGDLGVEGLGRQVVVVVAGSRPRRRPVRLADRPAGGP